jgi:hypothetical protein
MEGHLMNVKVRQGESEKLHTLTAAHFLRPSVLKLFDSSRKVFRNGENRIQFGDDKEFLDLVRNAADRSVTAILSRLGENVHQYIQSITVQVTEVFHRDYKVVGSFPDQILDIIEQWCCLVFINQVAAHFHDGIRAFVIYLVSKIHGTKIDI